MGISRYELPRLASAACKMRLNVPRHPAFTISGGMTESGRERGPMIRRLRNILYGLTMLAFFPFVLILLLLGARNIERSDDYDNF